MFVRAKRGKALSTFPFLIPVRQIESRKEMSCIAQIGEPQMLAKMRKKGTLKKMEEVLSRSPLSSEPAPLC
jgi:hypothetical protein